MSNYETKFMLLAIKEAHKALEKDEVPIGCVLVKDGRVLAKAFNLRESQQCSTAHAEILAINKACKKIKNWRLIDVDMFVTLEPCLMCAGAINLARIRTIYFGAYDKKGGAYGSSIDSLSATNINHKPNVVGGVLEKECSEMLTNYFKIKREKNEKK